MQRRPLGKTGEELSLIGFGGIVVAGMAQPDADAIVAEAFDRGINYFDVAPSYGNAEERLGPAGGEAGAELGEGGEVEPGVVELEPKGILPVDAAADGVGGLAIGEPLDVLEDGGQSQPCRRSGRLSAGGEEVGELVVAVEATELVGDAEAKGALGEGGLCDASGLFGDRASRLWAE